MDDEDSAPLSSETSVTLLEKIAIPSASQFGLFFENASLSDEIIKAAGGSTITTSQEMEKAIRGIIRHQVPTTMAALPLVSLYKVHPKGDLSSENTYNLLISDSYYLLHFWYMQNKMRRDPDYMRLRKWIQHTIPYSELILNTWEYEKKYPDMLRNMCCSLK